ncbi:MAG TPA: tol-pal system protein YbgF [Salinarimonas sp.]|jgi:tol-pal system protein YbgF|nr:tol-pal system protein YbgF [Salinarimonas sp.]
MLRRLALAAVSLLALSLPAPAQDAADIVVRLNRLENQVRQLSGEIERLQFENRQLREGLRSFQEDVEFRFQERGGAAPARPPAQGQPAPQRRGEGEPAAQPGPQRRGDAFDPGAQPAAPGAPRALGQTQPSAPLALPGAQRGGIAELIEDGPGPGGGGPLDLNAVGRAEAAPPRGGPSVAATGTGNARADYDAAYAWLLQKQYEQAEMAFRQFLQSHPRNALVPDALYWLGESYFQRTRHREAAEQFLKVSTDHAKAAKAPDAMLKLGMSLNALGAREQACATFAELERKFPGAANSVRQGVDREQKRARCA